MKRKVNKVGTNTLTVSLPSKWVKEQGLSQGDEIDLAEEKSKIIISTKKIPQTKHIDLDVSKYRDLVGRVIGSIYKQGYDTIRLTFDDPKTIEYIEKELTKGFIGLDIINSGKNFCELKSLADIKEEEFNNSYRRVFRLIIENAEELIETLKEEKFDELKYVAKKDDNVNKFSDLCRRILNKIGTEDTIRTNQLYNIVEELENIGDEFKYLANHFEKQNSISEEEIKEIEKVSTYFKEFYELFYSFSPEKWTSLLLNFKKLEEEGLGPLTKPIARKIVDLNGPILNLNVVT
ncbi:MAG: phosphate uptake regulator PhoU [Nanoarchaeota archaeon]|nr:phosphate uptake regulator PhoU [Nanoarchaeota archaeon]